MSTLVYAGVIAAGAVTLVIDAYKNYEQSLTTVPFREYGILNNVEVSKLCSQRERNIGFLFYSLLYLVTYAVALSSAEIYTLLQTVAQNNATIGPPDQIFGVGDDALELITAQYGKPIYISAAIIALFGIGAFRPVENTMRSLSHRLAGVPRGVYSVIEDLQNERFEEYPVNKNDMQTMPLCNRFDEYIRKSFAESTDSDRIPAITRALRGIDFLAPTVTGQTRIHHFPMIQLASMHELSDKLSAQLNELRNFLEKAPKTSEDRTKLFQRIQNDYHDTIAVLAVHFLRNNRAMKEQEKRSKARKLYAIFLSKMKSNQKPLRVVEKPAAETALDRVYRGIKRGYRVEHNSFGMSVLFAFCLSMAVCVSLLFAWNVKANPIDRQYMSFVIAASEDLKAREVNNPEYYAYCAQNPHEGVLPHLDNSAEVEFSPPAVRPDGYNGASCQIVWDRALAVEKSKRRKAILGVSYWYVLPMMLSVALAAITTIFGREVRHEDSSWPTDWTLHQIPFLRLFAMAVVPAVVAVLGVALGSMAKLLVDTGFQVTEKNVVDLISSSSNFMLMHLGVGFIVSLAVLMLIDRHDDFFNEQSLLLSLVFAAALLGWYFLVIFVGFSEEYTRAAPDGIGYSFETREALIHASASITFVILFAFFLEMTEDETNDRGWWTLRMLGFGRRKVQDTKQEPSS